MEQIGQLIQRVQTRYKKFGLLGLGLILIRELIWDRIIEGINLMIDQLIPRLPGWIESLLEWAFQDAFHLISIAGVIIIVVIFILSYRDGKKQQSQYKEQSIQLETSATVKVNVEIELFPRTKDGYASIKIHNEEIEDILKPELKYSEIDLIHGESSYQMLDEINSGNAAISRWLGGQTAIIGGRDYIVFNLAALEKHSCLFLFDDGTKVPIKWGLYKISVFLDGRIGTNEKKIERIIFKHIYLEYWTEVLERLEPRGDTKLRTLEKATFIDIRESVERNEKIEPSVVSELSMNEAIRYSVMGLRGILDIKRKQEVKDRDIGIYQEIGEGFIKEITEVLTDLGDTFLTIRGHADRQVIIEKIYRDLLIKVDESNNRLTLLRNGPDFQRFRRYLINSDSFDEWINNIGTAIAKCAESLQVIYDKGEVVRNQEEFNQLSENANKAYKQCLATARAISMVYSQIEERLLTE